MEFRDGGYGAKTGKSVAETGATLLPPKKKKKEIVKLHQVLDLWVFRNGSSQLDFRWSQCGEKLLYVCFGLS